MNILKIVGIGLIAIVAFKIVLTALGLIHLLTFTLFWGAVLYIVGMLVWKLMDKSK